MTPDYLPNRSWAEVNLDAIAHNVSLIRGHVRRSAEIMGVVKADSYGHGVEQVVPVLLKSGVNRLAVSMLDEAIQLRTRGIEVPILIMGYTDPRRSAEVIAHRLTQTVYSLDLAQALSLAAVTLGQDARIHIKVDTGMGRVGFMAGYEAIKAITEISHLPRIIIEGLYTHFATADEQDDQYTWQQFEQFMGISRELDRIGLTIPLKHVCNSAATMRFPAMHLDLVRPGLILYGMIPQGCPDAWPDLKPAMTLKSNLVLTKTVPAQTSISYGRLFTTARTSLIGTVPIGYADGYSRRLTGRASLLIHGQRAPVVGRICMDTCMADLTDLTMPHSIQTGDEVVLFGTQRFADQAAAIPVDEMADWMDTINYEVTCLIGKRVPRVYIRDGVPEHISNYLI
ncbi:MAG: alanine racemase [Eubacteriales bacterium]|nr:alanine racemase [Eubacteriales bacterium]